MYEEITYEKLLASMLDVALAKNPSIDVREGSPVWYGEAGAAVECQNLYIQLDTILRETFADTASRPYLIQRAKERGLVPRPATFATLKGEFTPPALELPIGTRFMLHDLTYAVAAKISPGMYKLICETTGEHGNEYLGTLIPVEYVAGLETAKLTEVLIPGEDEEDTELFRQRYVDSFGAQPFGGNVADYTERVTAISGVGGVKVYRAWNGDITPATLMPPEAFTTWFNTLPESTPVPIKNWLKTISAAALNGLLTVGGTVRLVLIDSTFSKPSAALIETVQTMIDPPMNHAEGLGLAPIGHFVTVEGVKTVQINITVNITYQPGATWADVKPFILKVVDDYFKDLAKSWSASEAALIIRISQLETKFLTCPGVLDVSNTTINGYATNFVLESNKIPIRGVVNG